MSSDKLHFMREFIQAVPFNCHLGMEVAEAHEDGATLCCTIRPELRNSHGVVHGGVVAALADAAVGVSLSHRVSPRHATTIDLKVNYLRPARAGKLWARCHLVRVGKTLVTGRVDLKDDGDRMVAIATATYMIVDGISP